MSDALATVFLLAFVLAFMFGTLTLFVGGVALGVPFYALVGGVSALLGSAGMLAMLQLS